jgi:hypothetical protein
LELDHYEFICRCVLDGELLVWDVELDVFKARTRNLNSDAGKP